MKQLIPKEKQRLYYIKWQDAHHLAGWMSLEQLQNEVDKGMWIAEEVGWIVYDDEKEVHIVARRGLWTAGDTPEYGMYQRIPKAWILKKRIIISG